MIKDNNGNLIDSPIHIMFELSYASFFVLPRLLMEAMPWDWQVEMVGLMEEFNEKFEWDDDKIEVIKSFGDSTYNNMDENLCDYRRGDATTYEKGSGEAV